jgi:16S rRNA (guanine(966)-N(2))-methyltransferase RsmD
MRTQLRIVAGTLRGRKLVYTVDRDLRPMPDMVRQALFNSLGDAVPGRTFFDLYAGTGAVGIEALSRGATAVIFVEREPQAAREISRHLRSFGVAESAIVRRADVHRWVEQWSAPFDPVIVFLGPPYPDLEHHPENLIRAVATVQEKVAPVSMVILQSDRGFDTQELPEAANWEHRTYGRNRLSTWIKRISG